MVVSAETKAMRGDLAMRHGGGEIRGGYITGAVAAKILLRQGHACAICGAVLEEGQTHFDHIVPVICGGRHTSGNMHALCIHCHHRMMLLFRDWFARRKKA
ncbi:HNH endonuclease [Methanoculleus frigidifontis]|nr:HNH endonuclease [Methanoculleus sp. FWC-SCC1]